MRKNHNTPLNFKEKYHSRISFAGSCIVLVVLLFLFNQIDYSMIRKPAKDAAREAAAAAQKAEEAALTPVVSTADVIAVGDNLYHGSLLSSGQYDSGIWNYDHIYANVLDEIQSADVAMIDQETILTTSHDSISGYPSFATPTEVADAIVKAGFHVVEAATNHVDDYGYDFMAQTLDFWKTAYPDIRVLGIHESQEDADSVKTLEVNGITIAFLDYTYGTNNSGAGEGREYMIDIFNTAKVSAAIQRAKEISDCIIFVAHWGKEDETMPTEYEKQWANFLMQQGVDVVIGGHPHVLQPYGRMADDQGNEMVIFYSLGNFVSGQEDLKELLGGMAQFTIEKTVLDGNTSIRILTPSVKPLVMHYNRDYGEFGVYMLEDYTEDLAAQHSVRELIGEEFTLANLKAKFDEIMKMNVTPSTNTNLLDVTYDYESNMIDSNGNIVDDIWSVSASQYYAGLAGSSSGSEDSDTDSGDYEDDSYYEEDSYYEDDAYYEDDSYYEEY